jgi:hypothetical protein
MRNVGGMRQYGAQQADILLYPALGTTKVLCPDGQVKTRSARLASVPTVPADDRALKVASAAAFGAVALSCEATNVLGMTEAQPLANAILTLLTVVTVVDNFYDVLRTGSQLVVRQLGGGGGGSSPQQSPFNVALPSKDSLPLELGQGKWTGNVIRGWTRLLTVDVEREAQCEAAALYAAYVLGLPCFAFRPNALEASVLLLTDTDAAAAPGDENDAAPFPPKNNNSNNNVPTSSGVLRMLIWLLAPVAIMESMTHAQLIMSDPREAQGFLQRLEDYYSSSTTRNSDNDDDNSRMEDVLFWTESTEDKANLLQWAYAEADVLLRNNKVIVKELSNRLTSGAATIGDCIAAIEGWQ